VRLDLPAHRWCLGDGELESPPRRPGDTDKDLLTAQDVAHMTGLSVHTLRWWRFNGGPGPKHLKLGWRIFYRRAEVEQWLARAGE
jgi:predicted DNA-binding transcriptional regulator AlpA